TIRSDLRLIAFCLLPPQPPASTPFPYTTLFRSPPSTLGAGGLNDRVREGTGWTPTAIVTNHPLRASRGGACIREREGENACFSRSEEHTSELQSRENLVCRLLLEKKKKTRYTT